MGLSDLCIGAARSTSIPARRRIGSSHTTFTYDGGILMKLDRDLQRAILQKLADVYPTTGSTVLKEIDQLGDDDMIVANMLYLEEHELLRSGIIRSTSGKNMVISAQLKITAKGLDFLADDGGLSAILGVVTIKLHDDTLKNLIQAKILQSDLSQPDKKRWLDQLRSLPAETTKHLVLKLVDLGLENAPAALAAIGMILKAGA